MGEAFREERSIHSMITVLPGVVGIAVFAEGAIEVRYPDMYMYQYCLMRALKGLFVIYTRCIVGHVAGTLREGQSIADDRGQ